MQPDPKQTVPPADSAAPLGEAISVVPGSFDSDAASSPISSPVPEAAETGSTPTTSTTPVSTAAGTRTIQPLSDTARPTPITDKVDPSEWLEPDTTPIKKQTVVTRLSVQFLKHRRLYSLVLALIIILIWGAVFAYFAVHGKHGL